MPIQNSSACDLAASTAAALYATEAEPSLLTEAAELDGGSLSPSSPGGLGGGGRSSE